MITDCQNRPRIGRQTIESEGWENPERSDTTRPEGDLGRKHKSTPLTEKIGVSVWPNVSWTQDKAR